MVVKDREIGRAMRQNNSELSDYTDKPKSKKKKKDQIIITIN